MSFIDSLHAAAEHDFDGGGDPDRRRRKLAAIVASTAAAGLALELLLSRFFPFALGSISSFVAIPVAMAGLSLGALAMHWSPKEPSARSLPLLVPALAILSVLGLVAEFGLFNHVFNLTHHWRQDPVRDAAKTVALTTACLPAFALVGVILSTAFAAGKEQLGRLYAVDLAGSALACLAIPAALVVLDLRYVLVLLVGGLVALQAYVFSAHRRAILAAAGAAVVVLSGAAAAGLLFVAHPDPQVLGGRRSKDMEVTEVKSAWNHISRVALLQFRKPGESKVASSWIVHDDGISNVRVLSYKPEHKRKPGTGKWFQQIPFLMDTQPTSGLVMFAGAGKDLVQMNQYSQQDMRLRGVELNGRVKRLATFGDPWKLQEFFGRDNVELRVAEGRGWLDLDDEQYDAIYVASNGAQNASRTGHARKFLDTHEAMAAYLDRLAPGGVIVFAMQDIDGKIEAFKRLLVERGHRPFAEAGAFFGKVGALRDGKRDFDVLVVKPSGLSGAEVDRLLDVWPPSKKRGTRIVKYAPGYAAGEAYKTLGESPADPAVRVPSDDRPYEEQLDWSAAVWPPVEDASTTWWLSWIKLFTLGFFGLLTLVLTAAFAIRPRGGRRLPAWLLGWFFATGILYMFAQVGLIAKLELFLGRPIYALAVVLAGFLLFNGAGSHLVGRRQEAGQPVSPVLLGVAAAVGCLVTLALADLVLVKLLALPVLLKIPLALLALVPVAVPLGGFYPTGVGMAVRRELGALVPMTFGLATLSSVLGSTVAMTWVINTGFRQMVAMAAVGYVVLALLCAVGGKLSRA